LKFRYLKGVIFFCLTWALSFPAQAQEIHRTKGHGLDFYNQILAQNPQDRCKRSLSHYILGVYYEGLGDLEEAVNQYHFALADDPQSSLLHLNLAAVYIQKDKPEQAVGELKQSIRLAPETVQPRVLLALVYASQNKSDLAEAEYVQALENAAKVEPGNADLYKGLGALYLQQKKIKQAEVVFKLAAKLSPLDPETHFYLGDVYYELNDYPLAEKELKAAIKIKPDYHEALNFLGYFYLEQDKSVEAGGELIRRALALDPDNGAYTDSLGWFYYKKGNFKEALRYIGKAASLLSDPEIYDHLGDVYLKLGDSSSAKINWEKSLKLDPQNDKVKAKFKNAP